MQRVAQPAVSPDGQWVAFVVTHYDTAANTNDSDLWLVPAGGGTARRVAGNSGSATAPFWSNDGRLGFLLAREGQPAQLWSLRVGDGEPQPLAQLPVAAKRARWLPGGRKLVFEALTFPDLDARFAEVQVRVDALRADKTQARISESRLLRYWDRYLTDGMVPHLFELDVASGAVRDLMPGFDRITGFEGFEWDLAADGAEIAFSANSTAPPHRELNFDIYALDRARGTLANLTPASPGADTRARVRAARTRPAVRAQSARRHPLGLHPRGPARTHAGARTRDRRRPRRGQGCMDIRRRRALGLVQRRARWPGRSLPRQLRRHAGAARGRGRQHRLDRARRPGRGLPAPRLQPSGGTASLRPPRLRPRAPPDRLQRRAPRRPGAGTGRTLRIPRRGRRRGAVVAGVSPRLPCQPALPAAGPGPRRPVHELDRRLELPLERAGLRRARLAGGDPELPRLDGARPGLRRLHPRQPRREAGRRRAGPARRDVRAARRRRQPRGAGRRILRRLPHRAGDRHEPALPRRDRARRRVRHLGPVRLRLDLGPAGQLRQRAVDRSGRARPLVAQPLRATDADPDPGAAWREGFPRPGLAGHQPARRADRQGRADADRGVPGREPLDHAAAGLAAVAPGILRVARPARGLPAPRTRRNPCPRDSHLHERISCATPAGGLAGLGRA